MLINFAVDKRLYYIPFLRITTQKTLAIEEMAKMPIAIAPAAANAAVHWSAKLCVSPFMSAIIAWYMSFPGTSGMIATTRYIFTGTCSLLARNSE